MLNKMWQQLCSGLEWIAVANQALLFELQVCVMRSGLETNSQPSPKHVCGENQTFFCIVAFTLLLLTCFKFFSFLYILAQILLGDNIYSCNLFFFIELTSDIMCLGLWYKPFISIIFLKGHFFFMFFVFCFF